MIFIDSNVPMYLVGAPHSNKDRVISLLTRLVSDREFLITDVEVYQEIMHRYSSIDRPEAVDSAFESLDAIVDEVLTFDMSEIREAREILQTVDGISARDALHVAIMRGVGASRILSFDRGFDLCPGVERLS